MEHALKRTYPRSCIAYCNEGTSCCYYKLGLTFFDTPVNTRHPVPTRVHAKYRAFAANSSESKETKKPKQKDIINYTFLTLYII